MSVATVRRRKNTIQYKPLFSSLFGILIATFAARDVATDFLLLNKPINHFRTVAQCKFFRFVRHDFAFSTSKPFCGLLDCNIFTSHGLLLSDLVAQSVERRRSNPKSWVQFPPWSEFFSVLVWPISICRANAHMVHMGLKSSTSHYTLFS